MKYSKYLTSLHWKNKKIEHYSKHDNRKKCYVCGSFLNLNVHHNSYSNINNEKLCDLVTLCNEHHNTLHEINKFYLFGYRESLKLLIFCYKNKIIDFNIGLQKMYMYNKNIILKEHKKLMKKRRKNIKKYTPPIIPALTNMI